ncbi:MAG: hypothetical protein IJP42_02515 [Selenomonadaceae bacterium]|nr:hypothetical protein [Selenomonadaceae bacterium]
MTEQERINSEVQMKLALQDAKFNAFVQEMRDFKTEMRDRDNQRVEDMREIRASIADMGKHVRNLSITSMAAIGAMVVTVIISLLRN